MEDLEQADERAARVTYYIDDVVIN